MGDSLAGGFRVHSFRDLGVFRPATMDASVPFESQDQCPACGTGLETYATLVAERGGRQMRLGCCSSCGYAGYRDRPTREWMARFYRDEWDEGEEKEEDALTRGAPHRLSETQQAFVRLVAEVASDRGKPLCDIGCGDGAVMKAFAQEGFRTLIGVESSRHRALLARAVSGFPVLEGDFESSAVAASLRERAPIGVFVSYHVLEHAYHPLAVIRACGELQDDGGYLALATPNFVDEPVPTTMFWLPHLHSFTPHSLSALLAAGGYEIVRDHLGYRENITVIARRVRNPQARSYPQSGGCRFAHERVQDFFQTRSLHPGRRYAFSWKKQQGRYVSSLKPVSRHRAIDAVVRISTAGYRFFASRLLGKFSKERYSLTIGALGRRHIDPGVSPIEIQFDGDIQLLVR